MSIQGKKFGSNSKKSSASKPQEDTSEKVRVMKERQSQWMRQREEAKAGMSFSAKLSKSATSVDSLGSRSRKSAASDFEFDSGIRDPVSNPRRKPLYEPPKRDHSNIITWSGAGDNTAKAKRPPSARSQHKQPTSSRPSKLDSSRSNKSDTSRNKPYEPLNYGGSSKPNPPEHVMKSAQALYNRLSEPIDSKQDNGLLRSKEADLEHVEVGENRKSDSFTKSINTHQTHGLENHTNKMISMSKDLNPDMINALAETVAQRLKTTLHSGKHERNATTSQPTQEGDMSTHLCPSCRTLMSGARHIPTALIPCGHTFCQVCVRDCRKCPDCQARVKSTAVNTVMQQIIGDFKAQKEKERLQKLEEQTRKYVEEYQSLTLRSNALADEAETILNDMEETTEIIFQEKKTVKKLKVDEEEIQQKISELQNQLTKNRTRLLDSQEKSRELEQQYEEEKQRLSLVEDTIKTITQSKERVKMLIHNFAPNLNLDNLD